MKISPSYPLAYPQWEEEMGSTGINLLYSLIRARPNFYDRRKKEMKVFSVVNLRIVCDQNFYKKTPDAWLRRAGSVALVAGHLRSFRSIAAKMVIGIIIAIAR